jgi:serine/threonine-protein kinase HipA
MPVRTESYVWDDQLPPVLQMNLPEGYLLQVLQEQFGPHIGASSDCLAVGHRPQHGGPPAGGRAGCAAEPAPKPIEVAAS